MKVNENTQVTLTLGQLKKLVKETTSDSYILTPENRRDVTNAFKDAGVEVKLTRDGFTAIWSIGSGATYFYFDESVISTINSEIRDSGSESELGKMWKSVKKNLIYRLQ